MTGFHQLGPGEGTLEVCIGGKWLVFERRYADDNRVYFAGRWHDKSGVDMMNRKTMRYAGTAVLMVFIITVQGMEINDINFRGRFTFPVTEETSYLWRGTRISPKDLEEGDNISITFTGLVQETSPARIQEVLKVQLLDDDFEG